MPTCSLCLQNEVLHLKHQFQEMQQKFDEQSKQVHALRSQRCQDADLVATAEMCKLHKAAPDIPKQQQPAQHPVAPASGSACRLNYSDANACSLHMHDHALC